jgi:PAS domain S-box-containing protein
MIVDGTSGATPPDELTQLRRRITELEQLQAVESPAQLRVFKAVVDNAPDAVGLAGLDGVVFYANTAYQTITGYGNDLIGMNFYNLYPKELHATVAAAGQKVLERGSWQGMLTWQHKDGHSIPIQVTLFLIYDEQGAPKGFTSIIRDVTEQQQAENERLILQEQVIAAQQAALRELSTPLIPIAENVVAMPLIGSLDSARAQQVIETLLSGVASAHATTAIVDITGVPVVDTQVANALLRAAQAVRLLGAHVILTGIRPEVAQTLVGLGLDLSGIVTRSTLQSGIAFALERTAAQR